METPEEDLPSEEITDMSRLQLLEVAHMCARAAWLFPDDHEQRMAALIACHNIGVDYVEMVAHAMDCTGADFDTARREVAEALRRSADRFYVSEALAGRVEIDLPD